MESVFLTPELVTLTQKGSHEVVNLLINAAVVGQQDFLLVLFAAEVIEDGKLDVLLLLCGDGGHVEVRLGKELGRSEVRRPRDVDASVALHLQRCEAPCGGTAEPAGRHIGNLICRNQGLQLLVQGDGGVALGNGDALLDLLNLTHDVIGQPLNGILIVGGGGNDRAEDAQKGGGNLLIVVLLQLLLGLEARAMDTLLERAVP